jgi:hypothetical protein
MDGERGTANGERGVAFQAVAQYSVAVSIKHTKDSIQLNQTKAEQNSIRYAMRDKV